MTPTATQNCPFYGYQMLFTPAHLRTVAAMEFGLRAGLTPAQPDFAPFNLIATHGDQCALITGAHSPCQLENTGQPVEWSVCPFVIGRLMVGNEER